MSDAAARGRDRSILLPDGRTMGYAEYGDPEGAPVVLFHGMPGSRLIGTVFDGVARGRRARILVADRPGYGTSSPVRGGTLLGYVDDVVALAETVRAADFAVLGVSGGGPYALACASRLPGRVRRCGLLSAIGPLALPRAMDGLAPANRTFFRLGRYMPSLVAGLIARQVRSSRTSMQRFVDEGRSPLPDVSPGVFARMMADQSEAVRPGSKGVRFDLRNVTRACGFPLDRVRVPVALWHGAEDKLAPLPLARYVADSVPGGTITVVPGAGHAGTLGCADEAMDFLMRP